ncbi:hypothetical protein [Pseudomonas sp. NBRC 111134]|nr:hypothetical protein [Pseudomonas sp. NBRC 111134]
MTANFEYDGLGRLFKTRTTEGSQYLETRLAFDEFDREVKREFDTGATLQSLTQGYDAEDAIVWKTLGEGEILEVLRHETYVYDIRGRLRIYNCEGRLSPEDPYGNIIREQVFRFDELDNITRVSTTYPEGNNLARYYFEEDDPAQLSRIENSHADYPTHIKLEYDCDGNLTCDDAGRKLTYDGLGRLISVEAPQLFGEAFDQQGNRVWDQGNRRFTADEQGNVIRVDVPSVTRPISGVRRRQGAGGKLLSAWREESGRLLWCDTVQRAETAEYGYDALDRLTSQAY